jgi:hypothetical protein
MKKHTFLLILFSLIAGYSSFSQKYETIHDPITNEKLVTANYQNKWVYLEAKNGQVKFILEWWFSGVINTVIPKGSDVIIKLENGEIITLKTVSDISPKSQANAAGVFSAFTYETTLDKALLAKLAASKPVLIRLPDVKSGSPDITGKDGFGNAGKKYFNVIQKGSSYLLENM